MPTAKRYLHDQIILLLISVNIFLTCLIIILLLLRIGGNHNGAYILQYRSNLGISAYKTSGLDGMLSFGLFGILVTVINIILSKRTYNLRRFLSISILGLGTLILLFVLVVSNLLLALR